MTVTRNEMTIGFNEPEKFILAIVEIDGPAATVHYVRRPFDRDPGFAEVGTRYEIAKLLERAEA